MKAPVTIRRRKARDDELSFESLRAEGIRWLQEASGTRWTDYNLHDPGLTLLEQLCYALTDLAYRSDFPVADHLCGPDGEIDFAALALHPPQEALPCRPNTLDDLRRVLLDRVSDLAGVNLAALRSGPYRGLYRLTIDPAVEEGADAICRDAQAVLMGQRNLCEDLDGTVEPVQPWWCSLHAQLEIAGPRDPLDVAADVYIACMRHLSAPVRFLHLDELQRQDLPLDRIFDGPAMQYGFIASRDLERQRQEYLFVGDLLELARAVDGVKEVKWLALQPDGGEPTTATLRWRDARAGRSLRLRLPTQHQADSGLQLWRRGSAIELPPDELRAKVDERRKAERMRRHAAPKPYADLALPHGRHRALQAYDSVQEQFPPTYGINRHGVPPSATLERQSQARQLRAYLALFEQQIANGAAQLHHLRDLFSHHIDEPASYWWQMLDDRMMPGLGALFTEGGAQASGELVREWRRFDPALERKGRVLDHLLALHGQSWPQNTLRQFWGYLDADEIELRLLHAKAAFVQQVVVLNRDRGAGFDYTRPAWDTDDNCSGLQRMASLLLGFADHRTRSLTAAVTRRNRTLAAADASRTLAESPGGTRLLIEPGQALPDRAAMNAQLIKLAPIRHKGLADAVVRAGLYRDRYWLAPRDGGGHRLVLGPDELGRYWPLADVANEAEALLAARCLREFVLEINRASEGLHVVEHLLLRPLAAGSPAAAPDDFHSCRLSVVFPAWTERCRQPNFRAFAEETVALSCPAHLVVHCLWLEFDAMLGFEACHRRWLEARLEHAAGRTEAAVVDEASRALVRCLREPHHG